MDSLPHCPDFKHHWSSEGSSWEREEQKAVKIQKQALNAIQDAWRTIPEDYLKILPNISGYVDELFFRLLYCNSVSVYTLFNKLLHLFHILAKSKTINGGLGLLHSALCALGRLWLKSWQFDL